MMLSSGRYSYGKGVKIHNNYSDYSFSCNFFSRFLFWFHGFYEPGATNIKQNIA